MAAALLADALTKATAGEVEALLVERVPASRTLVDAQTVRVVSRSRSRDEAIRVLADLLLLTGRVDDADRIEDAIWAREETAPTSVGLGIAIPHCVSPHVRADSIAAVRLSPPVAWGAGGETVDMAILIAVRPGAQGEKHLKTIAALSRRLCDDDFRERLLAAPEDAALAALLGEAAG